MVGSFFLTDFHVELYRRTSDRPRDELGFATAGQAKFLVRGFGEVVGDKVKSGLALGPAARFLVPLNHAGGVSMRLRGHTLAATTLADLWNGTPVATAALAADTAIDLPFEIPAELVERGVNLVDLEHAGVAPGQPAASYERLLMEERP